MPRTPVGVALALVALTGCGGSYDETVAPERPLPAEETTVTGGTVAQRELLRDLLHLFGRTGLRSLAVEPPKEEWSPFEPGDVVLRAAAAIENDPEADWEAYVLAGSFDAESRERGLPRLLARVGPGADVRVAGMPGEEARQPERAPVPAAAAVIASIEDALRRQDVQADELRVIALPGRPAVTLRIAADGDPARFLAQRLPFILAAVPRTLGASWVDVRGEDGAPVFRQGRYHVGGLAGGLGWTAPQLDACSPVRRSITALAPPERCPWVQVNVWEAVEPRRDVAEVEAALRSHVREDEMIHSLAVARADSVCRRHTQEERACPWEAGVITWAATVGSRGRDVRSRQVFLNDETGEVVER